MDEKSLAKERRKQAVLERLGTNSPQCVICVEGDPRCLEKHHLPGRKFGDDLVIVCRNCHRKLSDTQKDHPLQICTPPCLEERIAHFLHGLADLFELLIAKFREFADQLLTNINHRNSEKGDC
jgi:hypothetical protein